MSSVLRVLVVDDDPRVRAGLAGALGATAGLALAGVTGSAARAIALAAGGKADVALVDALLPTIADGVALVRCLSPHLPVVAISLDGTRRHEVLAAGAVAYVEKDGALDDLVVTLRGAAAHRVPPNGGGSQASGEPPVTPSTCAVM